MWLGRQTRITVLVVLLLLAAIVGWARTYRFSPLSATLGIADPSPTVGSRCRYVLAHTRLGPVPTGELYCTTRRSTASRPREVQVLGFGRTRRVTYATRRWAPQDSSAWRGAVDSIRQEFTARGGRRILCRNTMRPAPIAGGLEQWLFAEHGVYFFAAHHRGHTGSGPDAWTINMVAQPSMMACV